MSWLSGQWESVVAPAAHLWESLLTEDTPSQHLLARPSFVHLLGLLILVSLLLFRLNIEDTRTKTFSVVLGFRPACSTPMPAFASTRLQPWDGRALKGPVFVDTGQPSHQPNATGSIRFPEDAVVVGRGQWGSEGSVICWRRRRHWPRSFRCGTWWCYIHGGYSGRSRRHRPRDWGRGYRGRSLGTKISLLTPERQYSNYILRVW